MQDLDSELAAYAPNWVRNLLTDASAPVGPFTVKRPVCALFADVADFSTQTEKFALRGARGAEDLSAILNECFSLLVDTVRAHGGDIVAFAGDAVAVVWGDADLQAATLRAARCALTLQEKLREWAQRARQDMQLRVSIEAGEAVFSRVGGYEGKWRYVVSGDPLRFACASYRRAGTGQVLLCARARQAVGEFCEGDIVDGRFLRLIKAPAAPPARPQEASKDLPLDDLRGLIPEVVLERLAFLDRNWLAEFRHLSIVALQPGRRAADEDELAALQTATVTIQTIAARYEGAILDIIPNENGVCAYIAFGLPPRAHSDDPYLAVETAKTLRRTLSEAGVAASLGVASGRLFCGEYGGTTRRQYSVLGRAINLAARLMAAAGDGVLCDLATAKSAYRRVLFAPLGNIRLKGMSEPAPVFRPEETVSMREAGPQELLIGREAELGRLEDALDRLAQGTRQVVMLHGEAGVGKTRLLGELVRSARLRNFLVCRGTATAIERRTLYFVWREIPLQLVGAARSDPPAQIRDKLVAAFADAPLLAAWAPLLEEVAHVGFTQTALTEGILGAAMASNVEQLMLHLLNAAAKRLPTVLAFDDLSLFDGASRALLTAVARRSTDILIVVADKTDEDPSFAEDEKLPIDVHLRLEALREEAVAQFVRAHLGVVAVPDPLREFIHRYAGGNPFFCEELLLTLRDTGAIAVEGDACRIDGDLEAAPLLALSASVEGAIVARIDALTPQNQMALKVASVIGAEFSARALSALYPESITPEEMSALLDRLSARDLLRRGSTEGEAVYDFRHAIIRRVTYDQLSFAQRHGLHRQIADNIEHNFAANLDPLHAMLAMHREYADQPAPAIRHLERAAELALRSYANRDAIGYMRKAVALAQKASVVADDIDRSVWEIVLGDAHHELREYEIAVRHYERALHLLGRPPPATPAQTMRALVGGVLRQSGTRLLGRPPRAVAERERLIAGRAAHVYERLAEQYFYRNDSLRLLHGTLASLNLAERSGSVAETINGYNGLALGLGMSGLPAAARFYSRRAFGLAHEKGGPSEVARAHLVASVLASGLGERRPAEGHALEAALRFRALGDQGRLQNVLAGMAFESLMHGDLAAADRPLAELSSSGVEPANDTVRAWILCARVLVDTTRSTADQKLLDALRSVAARGHAPADRLLCLGALAFAHERRGEPVAAQGFAESGFEVLKSCKVVWAAYGVYGAYGVVGSLIAQCARAPAGGSYDVALQKAEAAALHFARASRTSPLCQPAATLHRGSIAFMKGRKGKAVVDWRRAARCAETLHMPYFSGIIWLRIAEGAEGTRAFAVERAKQAFEAVGATVDLANLF